MSDEQELLPEAELPGAEAPEDLLRAMQADRAGSLAETEPEAPVMENVTAMNRERYFEAAAVRGKSWKVRICTAIGVIAMATGLFLTHAAILILGVIATLLAMFSHVVIAYRDFGKLKRFHPSGTWTKTIRFYEDRVETDSGVGALSVAKYSDIKREYETRQMYVIDFGKAAPATTLHKDSFTVGSIEALRAFLLEKQREEYNGKTGRGAR